MITWTNTRGIMSKTPPHLHLHLHPIHTNTPSLPLLSHQSANGWKSEMKTGNSCWEASHPHRFLTLLTNPSVDFFLPFLFPSLTRQMCNLTYICTAFEQVKKKKKKSDTLSHNNTFEALQVHLADGFLLVSPLTSLAVPWKPTLMRLLREK